MKNKLNKISIITLLTIVFLLCNIVKVEAVSLSVSASKTSVTVGESFLVSVSASGTGRVSISVSNGSASKGSIFFDNGVPEGGASVTITPSGVGTTRVSISGQLADPDTGDEADKSSSVSVTVKEKESTPPPSTGGSSGSTSKPATNTNTNTNTNTSTNINKNTTTNTNKNETKNDVNNTTTDKDKEKKDDNKYLESLVVSPSGLKPSFSRTTFEYKLKVGSDIKNLKVNAITESDKARVEVRDNTDLKNGENKVYIIVTAEDESKQVYTITVTKDGDKEQLALNKLLLRGFEFTPEFDPTVYEYEVIVGKDVTEIPVEASSNIVDAVVEVIGNKDLPEGDSVITILLKLKGKDGEEDEVITYQIVVKREEETQAQLPVKYMIAGGAATAVIILGIIVIAIKKRSERLYDEEDSAYYAKSNNKVNKYDLDDDDDLPRRGKGKHF